MLIFGRAQPFPLRLFCRYLEKNLSKCFKLRRFEIRDMFHTERVIVLSCHCFLSACQNSRHSLNERQLNYYSAALVLKV